MKEIIEKIFKDGILYIGNEIPKTIANDSRPKFVVLGTPQGLLDILQHYESNPPIQKDFYNLLPSIACEALDRTFIPKFSKELWFNEAWEEYRQHVKGSNIDTMKMPMFIFSKFIKNS